MKLIYANVAKTTLAGPINSTTTTIVVQAGGGALFPNPGQNQYFTITMIPASTGLPGEIMWCTSRSGDTLTVIRAQEGTTGTAYLAGDTVSNRVTAGGLLSFAQMPIYPGNPNGVLAGQAGTQEISPDLVFDTATTPWTLFACTTGSSNPATTAWTQISSVFQTLQADANYYVNASTGSDSNTGTSPSTAWLTLQHAWNWIQSNLNLNGFAVVVNCTGAFTAGVSAQGSLLGGSLGTLALTFSFAAGSSVTATNSSCFVAQDFAAFTLTAVSPSLTMTASGTGPVQGFGAIALSGGFIALGNDLIFGSCATAQIAATGAGSNITYGGGMTVTGTSGYLMFTFNGGFITPSTGVTITASGGPTYTNAVVGAQASGSNVNVATTTFSGSVTGQRYNAFANGVINTNGGGATFIFGSSPGTVNLVGGVYGNGSGQYI